MTAINTTVVHDGSVLKGVAFLAVPEFPCPWPPSCRRATAYLDGLQHLLGRAVWSADAARDELFAYVAENLDDPGCMVAIDETGFLIPIEYTSGV